MVFAFAECVGDEVDDFSWGGVLWSFGGVLLGLYVGFDVVEVGVGGGA